MALVCLELAARLFDYTIGPVGSLYDQVVVGEGRHRLKPGVVVVPERYGDVTYRFNRLGYRDDDPVAVAKPRVVVVGDSVSFGLGVQQDLIWPAVLEARLRRRWSQASVDNLAVFAYHTGNEALSLERDGLGLRPDVVIVQFYLNDFSIDEGARGEAAQPTLRQLVEASWNRLVFRSAAYRRAHQLIQGAAWWSVHDARRRWAPGSLNAAEPEAQLRYLMGRRDDEVTAFKYLREMAGDTREAGAQFLLVVFPDEVQLFDRSFDGLQERISAFAAACGIPTVDLLPVFGAVPDPIVLYLDGVHLTARGHEVAAERIGDELLRLRPPDEDLASAAGDGHAGEAR